MVILSLLVAHVVDVHLLLLGGLILRVVSQLEDLGRKLCLLLLKSVHLRGTLVNYLIVRASSYLRYIWIIHLNAIASILVRQDIRLQILVLFGL